MNPIRLNSPSTMLPPLAGLLLIAIFAMLGFWQLERAEEKRATSESFAAGGEYLALSAGTPYEMYQRITATGHFLNERQFLLENIVQDGRLGYYVVTPFEYARERPLLLVNRGWLAKGPDGIAAQAIAVGAHEQSIRGRVGRLPRVAIKPGPAFATTTEWPRRAVWPALDDLAAELGQSVLPFVLLADPDVASGLERRWQPQQIGPMRHLGYAVQWFALALAVLVTGIVLVCRRRAAA